MTGFSSKLPPVFNILLTSEQTCVRYAFGFKVSSKEGVVVVKRFALLAWFLCALLLFMPVLVSAGAHQEPVKIDIVSKNVSHRIVLLASVETKLKLLIGFAITGDLPSGPEKTRATAVLSHRGVELASFTAPRLDYHGGNLAFYLTYPIAPGNYDLLVELTDIPSGASIAKLDYLVQGIEMIGARENGPAADWTKPLSIPLSNPPAEQLGAIATEHDNERGYILWHRNPFRYVYPNSAPMAGVVISEVSVRLAQDEYEPATFSLYALKNLGRVRVDVSKLVCDSGEVLPPPELYVVDTVPRMKNRQGTEYELRPRLLKKEASTSVEAGQSRRFWLTVHASPATQPGHYRGTITLTTDLGRTQIPLAVRVLPFSLVERPDKEYGFDMTYVFQEMTAQDLTEEERRKVYENGVRYYRSFKEHGLTTIIPHSPFVFRRSQDGSPDLRDLQAALKAFKEVGFTGPFIYYCGHLVQSSKPGWAGSSLGFDPDRHPVLMKEIISYARRNFPETNSIDLHWMPGDEVQDDRGGPSRIEIAAKLLKAIQEMNEKSAIAVWAETPWAADITLGGPRPKHGQHWQYPNEETTIPESVDDAESMRRAFGLSHVKSHYVGIAPWTFQTSENASGDPYTDLDTSKGSPEVMVAYPGTDGPLLTPEYEAMREGIDDGKYAHVLETRIERAKNSGDDELQRLGTQAEAAYKEMLESAENASLEKMDANRETMVKWILQLGPCQIPQLRGDDSPG